MATEGREVHPPSLTVPCIYSLLPSRTPDTASKARVSPTPPHPYRNSSNTPGPVAPFFHLLLSPWGKEGWRGKEPFLRGALTPSAWVSRHRQVPRLTAPLSVLGPAFSGASGCRQVSFLLVVMFLCLTKQISPSDFWSRGHVLRSLKVAAPLFATLARVAFRFVQVQCPGRREVGIPMLWESTRRKVVCPQ